MSARVSSPVFVGRAAELAALEAALAAAAEGAPRLVLVGGESGVGKSRLLTELRDRAEAGGARVLAGDCLDLGEAELPYAPIVAALRGLEGAEVRAALGPSAEGLAPLLPQLDGPAELPAGGPMAQGRLFELLLALFGALAERAPVVLVVDDLHWADRSTRDLLAFLQRNARRRRLLVVGTYRTDELHRRHPLRPFLAEAERAPQVTRITLERFTRDELAEQLASILGAPPAPRLVDDLYTRAEGNAFFTEELLAAAPAPGERLPENLRDALMLRVEALDPATQRVLRLAAVAGSRSSHALLAHAAVVPEAELLGGLREAVAHNVIVIDPGTGAYAFRHALMREALLDDLLPGERAPLHAALARALEADAALSVSGRGVAAELAHHHAAAHDVPAAFAASIRAADDAIGVAAFAEANAHLERAIELWSAVPEDRRAEAPSLVELHRRAAEAAHFAGASERATALARQALTLVDAEADPRAAALLHERLANYLWLDGYGSDALAAGRAAVALLPPDAEESERARVLSTEARLLMLLARGQEAMARSEEALAMARAAGDRLEEGRILLTLGAAMVMAGRVRESIAHLQAGRRIVEEGNDVEALGRAYVNLGEALDVGGRVAEAADVAREGLDRARREGLTMLLSLLASELALRLLRLGRWDEAAAALEEFLTGTRGGSGDGAAQQARALLDAMRGDVEGAERRLDEAVRLQAQAVGAMWTAPVTAVRAELAVWAGRPQDALEAIDREIADDEADDVLSYRAPLLVLRARAGADLAVRARSVGDRDAEAAAEAVARRAAADLEALLDEARRFGDPPPENVLHAITAEAEAARSARNAGTAAAWAGVADGWAGFGMPYPAAYARWRQAEAALEQPGGRAEAQSALSAAAAAARGLEARPLLDEVESLARRARLSLESESPAGLPVPPSAAERVGLTERELDVLRLIAAGETNRGIGSALFISEKTVSVHVSRILAKLDARGRVEAAGRAHALGLLEDADPGGGADHTAGTGAATGAAGRSSPSA